MESEWYNLDIEADGLLTWSVIHRCLERFAPRQRLLRAYKLDRDCWARSLMPAVSPTRCRPLVPGMLPRFALEAIAQDAVFYARLIRAIVKRPDSPLITPSLLPFASLFVVESSVKWTPSFGPKWGRAKV